MLCFGVEHKKTQKVYVVLHNLVDLEGGSIYEKLNLSIRIPRWQMLLAEYNIACMTRKAIKGSAITNHLADHVVEDYEPLNFDLPNEDVLVNKNDSGESDWWTLYFDNVVNISGNGAGKVIIFPKKKQYPVSVKLQFECTNNMAEYEACIIGLEVALELKAKKLKVFGYSLLIIFQVKKEWQSKDKKLKPYQNYLLKLANGFKEIKFTHMNRDKNQFVDALETLALMTQVVTGCRI